MRDGEALRPEGRWLLPAKIPYRHARVTKGDLWALYCRCNYYKFTSNTYRCQISRTRWERDWAKFVYRNWYQDSPTLNFEAPCLIYSGTMLFCRNEYIGESECSIDGRLRTHLQSALGPSKNNNSGVDSIQESMHFVIWTPIFMWNGRVTKAIRVAREGELIWERDPTWNRIGTETMRDPNSRMSTCVFGRKRRWRLVCRLIKKTRAPHQDVLNLGLNRREEQRENILKKRKQMCAIAARLSRRPLKYTAESAEAFWNLRTVQQIRAFSFPEFRSFIRTVFLCLDPIARSTS